MHAHFPLSYDVALSYLEKHAPQVLKALDAEGQTHFDTLMRHVDEDAYQRIISGDLTIEDKQQPDGFYITRHAAWVVTSRGVKDVRTQVR